MKQREILPLLAAIALGGVAACTVSGSLLGKSSSSSSSYPSTTRSESAPAAPDDTRDARAVQARTRVAEATPASAPRSGAPRELDVQRCTIQGKVNARRLEDCFKYLSYVFSPEKPDGNFDIGAWGAIGKLHEEVRSGTVPKLAADPGATECFAVANKLTKGRLDREYAWSKEHPRIQPTFVDVFTRQCNRYADLEDNWYPGKEVKVVVSNIKTKDQPKVAKDKRVAMSGTNPPYKILCNGEIVETLADGSTKVTEPWVHAPVNKTYLSRKDQCIETCRFVAGRPRTCDADTSSRLCKDDCERRCL